jgi:hypothetical protein
MEKHQLEMSFDGSVVIRPPARRQRRLTRARWWFGQMRRAAERAWDRQSAPPARLRQSCLPLPVSRRR